MTRSLVIGGNGFIGGPVAKRLAEMGHEVAVFDRFSRSLPPWMGDQLELFRGDFGDRKLVRNALKGRDHVFHFLSATTPASSQTQPIHDLEANVIQTLKLLDDCIEAGVKKFTFASSGGTVYGDLEGLATESSRPSPISPYGISKLAIENYLDFYRRNHGLDTCALRISNPYGPRQREDRTQGLIPIFLRRIRDGLPVIRMGRGTMVRDYVYMDDLVEMIMMVASRPRTHSVYNLGSGVGYSVNEVLAIVSEVTRTIPSIVDVDAPDVFVQRIILDNSRFHHEFGTTHNTSLHRGIAQVWDEMSSVV